MDLCSVYLIFPKKIVGNIVDIWGAYASKLEILYIADTTYFVNGIYCTCTLKQTNRHTYNIYTNLQLRPASALPHQRVPPLPHDMLLVLAAARLGEVVAHPGVPDPEDVLGRLLSS